MKTKALISIVSILLLYYSQGISQERRWSFGIQVAPGISWQHYYEGADSALARTEAEQANGLMKSRFSYSLGFNTSYQINPRLSLRSGVAFSRKGGRTQESTFEPTTDTSPFTAISQSWIYDHFFISVPLVAGYTFPIGNHQFRAGIGINADLYLRTHTINEISSLSDGSSETIKSTNELAPYRDVILSGIVSLEYLYNLTDDFQLYVGPRLLLPWQGLLQPEIAFVNHAVYVLHLQVGLNFSF